MSVLDQYLKRLRFLQCKDESSGAIGIDEAVSKSRSAEKQCISRLVMGTAEMRAVKCFMLEITVSGPAGKRKPLAFLLGNFLRARGATLASAPLGPDNNFCCAHCSPGEAWRLILTSREHSTRSGKKTCSTSNYPLAPSGLPMQRNLKISVINL